MYVMSVSMCFCIRYHHEIHRDLSLVHIIDEIVRKTGGQLGVKISPPKPF